MLNVSYIGRPVFVRSVLIFFILVTSNISYAQLCNGTLGDPVVNITFGSGSGSNTGYTPTNAYTFTGSPCPDDGYYTITTSTSNCFGNTWHTVTTDHTGNGAFLLVNATHAPGDFLVTTVKDLCPNTTYEFAAWILNIINRASIKPNITFSIETDAGMVLQQYSTGDIPETAVPTWKQYGFFFTTPASNPVIVLRMTNNAPGGIGNDIAMDDITFRPCSAVTLTAAIAGNKDTVNICEDNNSTYNFTGTISTGYTFPVYQWQLSIDSGKAWKDISGANAINYQRTSTGVGAYWYRLTVTEQSAVGIPACRIASKILIINVRPKPYVNAGGNRTMIAGNGITLNGEVRGDNPVYYWDPPDYLDDANLMTPFASPLTDKTYKLYAASTFGCSSEDVISIKVVAGIFIPNAFTPNNDGKNDSWRIPFLDPTFNATVNVYNRFGQLVYHTQSAPVEWDGNFKGLPQASGTYVYHISFAAGYPELKGTVLLLR